WLHVVELDGGLAGPLAGVLAPFDNTRLHVADAMQLDLAALTPAPTKVVANLPYNIAAGAILRTVFELPTVELWACMVQREVGERFAAKPGSRTYGIPSVLAQISCEVRVLRGISRNVFHPVPRVDSALVGLRRRAPGASLELRAFVQGAFAHRRKALARSLALSRGLSIERVRVALVDLGHPPDERAERLAPEEFEALLGRCAS
ncbi:MAG: ribosomal RNA small subunit methyltransferase A, partial [Solirubrobacteraceae bacterium]